MGEKCGRVAADYRYDPFGKLLAKTGALDQPFQFSTKRFDERSGLSYYGYRFYSTEPDRWTTRDPLGEAGGVHLYAFVGNDPVNWVDPHGLMIGVETIGPILIFKTGGFLAAASYALLPVAAKAGWIAGSWINERWVDPWLWDENENESGSDTCPVPGTTPGKKTKGKTKQREKDGDFGTANDDFDSLNPSGVRELPDGTRIGKLPDGRTIIVRPKIRSKKGRPTIEIQRGKKRIKVRYGQ